MNKKCTQCQTVQPVEQFHKNAQSPDGLHSHCKTCKSAYAKKWRSDPSTLERSRANSRQWYEENKEHAKAYQRHKRTGATPEKYDLQLQIQEKRCAWCGEEVELCADHCHVTGNFRRLLCGKCNRAEGLLKHAPQLLEQIENAAWWPMPKIQPGEETN